MTACLSRCYASKVVSLPPLGLFFLTREQHLYRHLSSGQRVLIGLSIPTLSKELPISTLSSDFKQLGCILPLSLMYAIFVERSLGFHLVRTVARPTRKNPPGRWRTSGEVSTIYQLRIALRHFHPSYSLLFFSARQCPRFSSLTLSGSMRQPKSRNSCGCAEGRVPGSV